MFRGVYFILEVLLIDNVEELILTLYVNSQETSLSLWQNFSFVVEGLSVFVFAGAFLPVS